MRIRLINHPIKQSYPVENVEKNDNLTAKFELLKSSFNYYPAFWTLTISYAICHDRKSISLYKELTARWTECIFSLLARNIAFVDIF